SFSARLTLRKAGDALSLVMPEARLRGSGGDVLLGISRLQYSSAPDAPRLSGNFTTGGPGLPRIAGRMEQGSAGEALLHLRMEEYRVKGGSLALPELMVAQGPGGALGFAGTVRATGALPGGFARNLR